jgi:hypothetical protein
MPTGVEVTFVEPGSRTPIDIEHRGWERLGARGEGWRDRNRMRWPTLLPHFRTAVVR